MSVSPDQPDVAMAMATARIIIQRAKAQLAPLEREMTVMEWAPEYRAIMWEAVMEEADAYMRAALRAGH